MRSGQRAAGQVIDLKAGKTVAPQETVAEAAPKASSTSTREEKKGFFSRFFN